MLQKYSELFGVTIDYLVKEDIEEPTSTPPAKKNHEKRKLLKVLGFVISLLGCVSLITFGTIAIFGSSAGDKIAGSSVIITDGMFVAMLLSVLLLVFGTIILIKSIKRK